MKNNAYQLLPKIKSPDDFRNFNNKQLNSLCAEIRDLIIKTVSQNGGHLASNLGVVELTVALHKSFHSPEDSIIFDVSHQCYAHKILTGRYDKFGTLRQNGGISGFSNPDESMHDIFKYGHSSTSISAALGLATAKKLKGNDSYTIAVIGDGALSSGLAYEGLNNAGHSGSKFIVVLNDNKMSIAKNVGGIARHLASIRSFSSYHRFKGRFEKILLSIPFFGRRLRDFVFKTKKFFKNIVYHSNIFEDMGFNYYGPIDGHNLKELEHVFESSKISKRPAVVHIITKKGYGYIPAEEYPSSYHSTGKFKVKSGV
ncbi:MAG: 1-deoxy-D-xylulose-5-phosphate synthase N-terminal domain-containing protein, partial [Acutalibacteraceae bacterium]